MIRIRYKGIRITVYTDRNKFVNSRMKPFGDLPKGAILCDISSTGFCVLPEKRMWLYVSKELFDFRDLLSTVSHELGHLIEGGFKKNPPEKDRYFKKHEKKAEHYEKFTLDAFDLARIIETKIK